MRDGEELEHSMLNRSIESAQKKVEQQNYSIRKRLLQYDDVLNQQREVIYGTRNAAIHIERPKEIIFEQVEEELISRLEGAGYDDKTGPSDSSINSLVGWLNTHFPIGVRAEDIKPGNFEALTQDLVNRVKKAYEVKESVEVPEALAGLERYVIINAIDKHWQEHLTEMEELRRAIGLRSYGQKDPLVEYKGEAFKYFEELMDNVRVQICTGLFRSASNLQSFENMLAMLSKGARTQGPDNAPTALGAAQPSIKTSVMAGGSTGVPGRPSGRDIKLPMPKPVPVQAVAKVGRNEPCPCGSGKKYKQCHGR